jgi:hypothetical protein
MEGLRREALRSHRFLPSLLVSNPDVSLRPQIPTALCGLPGQAFKSYYDYDPRNRYYLRQYGKHLPDH